MRSEFFTPKEQSAVTSHFKQSSIKPTQTYTNTQSEEKIFTNLNSQQFFSFDSNSSQQAMVLPRQFKQSHIVTMPQQEYTNGNLGVNDSTQHELHDFITEPKLEKANYLSVGALSQEQMYMTTEEKRRPSQRPNLYKKKSGNSQTAKVVLPRKSNLLTNIIGQGNFQERKRSAMSQISDGGHNKSVASTGMMEKFSVRQTP